MTLSNETKDPSLHLHLVQTAQEQEHLPDYDSPMRSNFSYFATCIWLVVSMAIGVWGFCQLLNMLGRLVGIVRQTVLANIALVARW